jgi:hypothetical protein
MTDCDEHDIDLLGKLNFLCSALDDLDFVAHLVVSHQLARKVRHSTCIDTIDFLGTSLHREHRKNARAASNIANDLALEVSLVL